MEEVASNLQVVLMFKLQVDFVVSCSWRPYAVSHVLYNVLYMIQALKLLLLQCHIVSVCQGYYSKSNLTMVKVLMQGIYWQVYAIVQDPPLGPLKLVAN